MSSVRPPNADGCELRRRGCVATETREELLLTLGVLVARRRAVAVRESASRQRVTSELLLVLVTVESRLKLS